MKTIFFFSLLLHTNLFLQGMEEYVAQFSQKNPYSHHKKDQSINSFNFPQHRFKKITTNENEISVSMWNMNFIQLSWPTPEKIIYVPGLGGCIATMLHVRYENNYQFAGITVFPLFSYQKNKAKIIKLCQQACLTENESKNNICSIKCYFIYPSQEKINSKLKIEENNSSKLEEIAKTYNTVEETIKNTFKNNAYNIYYEPYMMGTHKTHEPNKDRDIIVTLQHNKSRLNIKNKIIYL